MLALPEASSSQSSEVSLPSAMSLSREDMNRKAEEALTRYNEQKRELEATRKRMFLDRFPQAVSSY